MIRTYIDSILKKDTSSSYGYSTSRDVIITEAFRKIGALGDGETLDPTRNAIGISALNSMVQSFAAYGMNIWTLDRLIIPFSMFTGNYLTVGPAASYRTPYKPLKLLEASRIDDDAWVPLIMLTNRDYELQTNKTQTGCPTMVYYKPNAYDGVLYLWQSPDTYWADKHLSCTFQRQIQSFSASTDAPDFPPEWHEALIYNLAVRLAPNYGLPPNDRNILKQEAKAALDLVLSHDQEEGSLFIRADWRR